MARSALFARFQMDTDKEETGVWVNFGGGDETTTPPVPDIKVKIRRMKSKASIAARTELDKPHTNEIRRGTLAQAVFEDLLLHQMARGVIVDWSGVTDEDGSSLPYSPQNAYTILKKLPEFRDEIFAISMDREVFRAQIEKESEENLSNT